MVDKYYKKNKEKIRKEAHKRYQNLSEEEKEKIEKRSETDIKIFLKRKKEKRRQYYREYNKNLSEEEKKEN